MTLKPLWQHNQRHSLILTSLTRNLLTSLTRNPPAPLTPGRQGLGDGNLHNSPSPNFRCEGQFVEFDTGIAPSRVVFLKDGDEAVVMSRLKEVGHLMDDDVLEQVLGLLHQFRIQPDIAGLMTAATPLGLHPL